MTGAPSTSSGSTPGVSLQAVIEAPRRLDELSTARVIGEAAEAVHKAQKGGQPLGTLMPQAILVATSGISLAPPATASVAYTAPERLRGGAGDRRSDVFSLGVVLWEALAHERLFDAATDDARKTAVLEREIHPPSEHNANVPAELDAICKKALDRDPANRYQSAKVMAAEISAVLDDAGYPDSHDEIESYLAAAFPAGAAAAPSTTAGAALAAKLAATPATATGTRQQLNMTMHGMAPIREPAAKSESAKVEPAKVEPAKLEAPKPEPAKVEPAKVEPAKPAKLDPGKTIPAGSGLSIADLPQAATAAKTELPSNLSPMAFSTPAAPTSAPGAPTMLAAPPMAAVEAPATKPPLDPAMITTQPGTGIQTVPPADDYTALAKPKAMIVEEAKPKASISNAETLATPALVAMVPEPAAASSGIAGLPSMPPGAGRSFDDDFATNAGSKPHPEMPVAQASVPAVSAPVIAVDPSAAVSLPRPRRESRPGTDKGGTPDVLADWGWKSDSHAAIVDDGGHYEDDSPNAGRKRLLYAAGGAIGAILLIIVIAVAASGGGDDKDKAKEVEAPIADTSRTAESSANAKMADPEPAPTAPAPVEPAAVPAPVEPTKVEPTPVEPTKAAAIDPATTDAEARKAAKLDAARAEAAKVETAKAEAETAKAEAETAKAAKLEAARLAKLEAANAAAAKRVNADRLKAEKAEAARIAKAARVEAAKTAPVETAKVQPPKEPRKKEPKLATITSKPVDPYAPEKAPKADPSVAYKTGFQQYVRGDTSGALSTFKGSLAASPGYPPTWRGLGLVYEKMGQKAQAKKSFLRYLQLSPKASDAEQIRTRMEKLGT